MERSCIAGCNGARIIKLEVEMSVQLCYKKCGIYNQLLEQRQSLVYYWLSLKTTGFV